MSPALLVPTFNGRPIAPTRASKSGTRCSPGAGRGLAGEPRPGHGNPDRGPLRRPVRARAGHCAVLGRREDPHRSRRKAVRQATLPAADAVPCSLVGKVGEAAPLDVFVVGKRPGPCRGAATRTGGGGCVIPSHPLTGVSPMLEQARRPQGAQRRAGAPRRQRCVLPRGRLRARRPQVRTTIGGHARVSDEQWEHIRQATGLEPIRQDWVSLQAELKAKRLGGEPKVERRLYLSSAVSWFREPGRLRAALGRRDRAIMKAFEATSVRALSPSTAATRRDSPWRSRSTEASTCSRRPTTTGRCVFGSACPTRRSCTSASSGP